MSKHTPGPWRVKDRYYIHQEREGCWSHAEVKCCPGIPPESEQHEANALLISAAPDLLEALQQLTRFCCRPGDDGKYDDGYDDARRMAVAAIAKATEKAAKPA